MADQTENEQFIEDMTGLHQAQVELESMTRESAMVMETYKKHLEKLARKVEKVSSVDDFAFVDMLGFTESQKKDMKEYLVNALKEHAKSNSKKNVGVVGSMQNQANNLQNGKEEPKKDFSLHQALGGIIKKQSTLIYGVLTSIDRTLKGEGGFKKLEEDKPIFEKKKPPVKLHEETLENQQRNLLKSNSILSKAFDESIGKHFKSIGGIFNLLTSLIPMAMAAFAGIKMFSEGEAFKGTGSAILKTIVNMVKNRLYTFVQKIFPKELFEKAGKEIVGEGIEQAGKRLSIKAMSKVAIRTILRSIPWVGTVVGIGFALERLYNGDLIGFGLELISAVASIDPTIGFAISLGVNVLIAYRDLSGASEKQSISWGNAWESVKGWFMDALDGITSFFSGVWNNITKWVKIGIDWLSEIPERILTYVSNTWNSTKDYLEKQMPNFSKLLSKGWNKVNEWYDEVSNWLSDIPSKIKNRISDAWNSTKDYLEKQMPNFSKLLSKGWNKVNEWYDDAVGWIVELPSAISKKLKNITEKYIKNNRVYRFFFGDEDDVDEKLDEMRDTEKSQIKNEIGKEYTDDMSKIFKDPLDRNSNLLLDIRTILTNIYNDPSKTEIADKIVEAINNMSSTMSPKEFPMVISSTPSENASQSSASNLLSFRDPAYDFRCKTWSVLNRELSTIG